MSENVFSGPFEDPFVPEEEWIPLQADNMNSSPGVDMPTFAEYRPLRVAAMMITVDVCTPRPRQTLETAIAAEDFDASGRVRLASRVRDWFLSDPA